MQQQNKLTFAQVARALRERGLTIRPTGYDREYRINYRGGSEATAYYTNDLEDAFYTGRRMHLAALDDLPPR